MTNRMYKRIFDNKTKLQEMLTLKDRYSWSYKALAMKFNCDHTSIIYQCQKHGLVKKKSTFKLTDYRKQNPEEVKSKYAYLLEEDICQGYNYEKYLEKENKRTT